jgi:hypothetical protein
VGAVIKLVNASFFANSCIYGLKISVGTKVFGFVKVVSLNVLFLFLSQSSLPVPLE